MLSLKTSAVVEHQSNVLLRNSFWAGSPVLHYPCVSGIYNVNSVKTPYQIRRGFHYVPSRITD